MSKQFFNELDVSGVKNFLILLDIDGTIVCDSNHELDSQTIAKIGQLNKNNRVFFCSNNGACDRAEVLRELTGVPCLKITYCKPSKKIMKYLDNADSLPLLVIGDKFLTDGLFARNIGAEFIKTKRMISSQDSLFIKATYLLDDFIYFFFGGKVAQLVKLLRPQQWIKNLFIFVPIFFVKQILIAGKFTQAFWAFAVFCSTASAMYIINDIFDREVDLQHPKKQKRPIASGQVLIWQAGLVCCLLTAVSLFILYFFVPSIWPVMLGYVVLNLLYSYYLKKVVIFDLMVVSSFYLLRVLAGGMATSTAISHWLVLCVIFVTLFIIIGKRMSEFQHLNKREVLRYYNLDLLEHLLTISAGLTIVSYGLYSILGSTSPWAVYSTFFVILGIFRYLYIIHTSPEAEFPEKLIISDKVILGSVIMWMVYMYLILY